MATDIEKVKLENTLRRFKRYLNVGFESSEVLKSQSELDNIKSLNELITEFKNGGQLAVEQIRLMSKAGKLFNRSYIVTALAFCARNSNTDLASKRAAYSALKEVCWTPFELFLFLDKREFFNVQFLLKNAVRSDAGQVAPSVSTAEINPGTPELGSKLLEKRENLTNRSRPSSAASAKANGHPVLVEVLRLADSNKSMESPRNSVVLPKINHEPALSTPRIGSGKKPLSPIPIKAQTGRKEDENPQMISLPPKNNGKQMQQLSSKGWGRLQRKHVNDWYTSQDPVKLARSVIKYQKKYNWCHKDVFCMSHPKSSNLAHNFIFKYVTGGLAQAQAFYESVLRTKADFKATKSELSPEENVFTWRVETKVTNRKKPAQAKKKTPKPPTRSSQVTYQLTSEVFKQLDAVRTFLTAFHSLKTCKDEQEVCKLIREHSFTDHQVQGKWLSSKAIWLAIMECSWFTPSALIRRFMILARRQMIRKNLRDKIPKSESGGSAEAELEARIEQIILEKLRIINSFEPVHPVEIFTVLRLYEHAKNDRIVNRFVGKKASWPVNESVNKALNDALELSFQRVEPSERKLCFSLNCFKHSRARTRKNGSMTPFQAMTVLFKSQVHESSPTSRAFAISGSLVAVPIEREQAFQALKNSLFNMYLGSGSSNHLAVDKALSDKEHYDAFVIYTNIEPHQLERLASAFSDYSRQIRGKERCKLIFISFSRINQSVVRDSTNMNILELTGLSNQTPQIINNFLNDLF